MAEAIKITLSDPLHADLVSYRGDSGRMRLSFSEDEDPIDVSAAEWLAQIKQKADDTEEITHFDIENVIGDTASVDVILTSEHSALLNKNCVYDIQMGLTGPVSTVMSGAMLITKDVSRS